jgi:predicted TIM-barrel fold metal-dependent hydrolase
VAIGESLPYMPAPWDETALVSRVDAIANILKIVEVAQQHGVAARIHTGIPYGYTAAYSYGPIGPANVNPLWTLDIAAAFPDVTLIYDHGGIQAGSWERFYEECLTVIAANDNVHVETGLWWRELYEKPLMDPNIGPSKLLWGTDWGASMQIYSQLGRFPPSYAVQLRGEGIPHHQVDYWGWSLRELTSVRIAQDDMNLILGGNAARIFDLDVRIRACSSRPPIGWGKSARPQASTGAGACCCGWRTRTSPTSAISAPAKPNIAPTTKACW